MEPQSIRPHIIIHFICSSEERPLSLCAVVIHEEANARGREHRDVGEGNHAVHKACRTIFEDVCIDKGHEQRKESRSEDNVPPNEEIASC